MDQTSLPSLTPAPARRLSRLALSGVLLLAALFLAVAALVITAPQQKNPLQPNGPQDQRAAEAAFLNNPPRRPVAPPDPRDPQIAELLAAAARADRAPSGPLALGAPRPPDEEGPAEAPEVSGYPRQDATAPPPGVYRPYPTSFSRPTPAPPVERPSWQAAFGSSLTGGSGSSPSAAPSQAPPTPPPFPSLPPLLAGPSPAPLAPGPPAAAAPPRRSIEAPASFHTVGPRTLRAGSILDALLLTALQSDSAGDAVAQISHDVYGADGRVLLPRGTRLIGSYQNRVALGQNRLAISWDRLVVGERSFDLPGLPTTSPDGAAGLPGDVNHHTALVFGRAALLSLLSAGSQLGQPRQSRLGAALSNREVVGGTVSQQLSQAAAQYLNQAADVTPTIFIPAGSRVTVLLPFDLELSNR